MHAVLGPVVTREGGYGFDLWTPEEGLSRSFCYPRVENAHYARNFEIKFHARVRGGPMLNCATLDQFASLLASTAAAHRQLGQFGRA
jgi:hypothetical protein